MSILYALPLGTIFAVVMLEAVGRFTYRTTYGRVLQAYGVVRDRGMRGVFSSMPPRLYGTHSSGGPSAIAAACLPWTGQRIVDNFLVVGMAEHFGRSGDVIARPDGTVERVGEWHIYGYRVEPWPDGKTGGDA